MSQSRHNNAGAGGIAILHELKYSLLEGGKKLRRRGNQKKLKRLRKFLSIARSTGPSQLLKQYQPVGISWRELLVTAPRMQLSCILTRSGELFADTVVFKSPILLKEILINSLLC